MKNKKIVIISLFYYESSDNIRINTVYHLLKESGADVELITTDFNHRTKQKHSPKGNENDITYLPVPEYKKNLSWRRIWSHLVFAFRLRKHLNRLKYSPSVVYCLVPAVSAGRVAASYCKRKNITFAVDVIDLWPESFVVLSSHKKLLQLLTKPWKNMAEIVYAAADLLFAGSADYALYAQQFNRKTTAVPVYLGTDVKHFKKWSQQSQVVIQKTDHEQWICFGGMLGNSYDIDIILQGFKQLAQQKKNLKLIFIGGGQESDKILEFQHQHHLNIEVTGFLNYADYLNYLSHADIAVNSFKASTRVAYSYKFNDYLSAGVPVLNNVKGEMAELISTHHMGRNFEHTATSFVEQLREMLETPGLLEEMRKNVTFVAKHTLDKRIVYQEMLDQLMNGS